MKIAEYFISVQGEGPQMGLRSLFIRTSGCNLKCSFCDTKYAKTFADISNTEVTKIIKRAYRQGVRNVVWTGGEPFLQVTNIVSVIEDVKAGCPGMTMAVETNGMIMSMPDCFDVVVVSPKDTEMDLEYLEGVLDYWINQGAYIKPVIGHSNINWWMGWAQEHLDAKIYFMPMTPQNYSVEDQILEHNNMVRWIIRKMDEFEINAAVSPRLHVIYRVR